MNEGGGEKKKGEGVTAARPVGIRRMWLDPTLGRARLQEAMAATPFTVRRREQALWSARALGGVSRDRDGLRGREAHDREVGRADEGAGQRAADPLVVPRGRVQHERVLAKRAGELGAELGVESLQFDRHGAAVRHEVAQPRLDRLLDDRQLVLCQLLRARPRPTTIRSPRPRVRTEQGGPTAVDAGPGEIGLELDPGSLVGCVSASRWSGASASSPRWPHGRPRS